MQGTPAGDDPSIVASGTPWDRSIAPVKGLQPTAARSCGPCCLGLRHARHGRAMEYPKSAQRLPICLASPWPSPRHSPGRPLPKARAHPISLVSLEDDCSSACDHFLRASPVGRHIVNTARRGRGAGFHAPRWEPKGPRGQIKDLHRSQRALPRTAARTEYAPRSRHPSAARAL